MFTSWVNIQLHYVSRSPRFKENVSSGYELDLCFFFERHSQTGHLRSVWQTDVLKNMFMDGLIRVLYHNMTVDS